MNIYTTILIEFLFIASTILLLFRFRSYLGLAPLYILLGAIQYLQVFASASISFEILEAYRIYPVSIIIFSGVLFAVLLIYIKEGVASARTLILGIIISNFLLTAIAGITYFQENILGMISENAIKSTFIIDYKYFIIGTIILLFDFILLVTLYQFLISRASKLYYFLILFISLTLVLFFDSVVFNLILKFGDPEFTASIVGHIVGKTLAAFGFSLILYIYLKYLDKEKINTGFIANQRRDIFSIITYQKKYLDLKVEKEKVEKKLVSQIESTLNNISDGFVSLDTNWCYTYVNIKAGEFLGRSPDSLIGKHIWTEFPDGVGLPFYNAYYKAVETQQTQYFQEFYQPMQRWFENRVYPTSEGLTIYFTDINEQKKAELALKESENHIRTILETEPECIKQLNAKGELIYMNPAGLAMIEADNLEMVKGKSVLNLISPNYQRAFKKLTVDVFNGNSRQLVFEVIGIKGTKRWLETHAVPLKDTEGNIISLLGVTRDITERKNAEELLLKNEKYLDTIINNVGDPIFVKDDQSRLLLVNDAFCNIFNLAKADIIGKTLAEDVTPEEREIFLKIDKQVIATGIENINEESLTVRDGEVRIISTKKTRFIDDSGKKILVGIIRDITERKFVENKIAKTNDQLTQANKELNVLRNQLEQENIYLRNEIDLAFNYEEMVYGSLEFSDVLSEIEKVAPTTATVLLLGESGTGKELLARAIHNTSLRNNKPLIKVNCSAIPRELIESELFGHKKGSFTGAISDRIGKFELADGGTLFLDEIGELPLDMQPKILRFLQEGEIEVVGGTDLRKLDVRVIAATNRNLIDEIEKGQFREDLYFRLNVFPIEVPPLRKRKDDIPLLIEHFIDKFNKSYAKSIKYIPDDSMNQLKSYNWPGNIRELENLIERASILSTDETLLIPGFESKNQKSKTSIIDKNLSLDHAQRNHIQQILEQCNWKISGPNGAAILLDLKASTLRDKMTKLGIVKPLKK